MKIIKTVFELVVGGLILSALFFFDANPVIWGLVVLLYYAVIKVVSLFGNKKHPKSVGVRTIISDPMPITFWEKLKYKIRNYLP